MIRPYAPPPYIRSEGDPPVSALSGWVGGNDALADVTDVKQTTKELIRSEPELLYLDSYGHVDFIVSVEAKDDVCGSLIKFF